MCCEVHLGIQLQNGNVFSSLTLSETSSFSSRNSKNLFKSVLQDLPSFTSDIQAGSMQYQNLYHVQAYSFSFRKYLMTNPSRNFHAPRSRCKSISDISWSEIHCQITLELSSSKINSITGSSKGFLSFFF